MYAKSAFFLFFFILMIDVLSAQPSIFSQNDRLKHYSNFPSRFVPARDLDVYLPPGYFENPKKDYSLLIMHDGQNLFSTTTAFGGKEWKVDETMDQLINQGEIEPCIVVGVWNTGNKRFSEYLPQKPMEALPDSVKPKLQSRSTEPLNADHYLQFLVDELLPFIEKTYRVKSGKKHHLIGGSSMGGLISMYAICEYPKVFGGAACFSTHWPVFYTNDFPAFPNALIEYFATHLPDPKDHKIYFDYGTATLDALYKPHQTKMDAKMTEHGYTPDVNWMTREYPGAEHSEVSWSTRFDVPIKFLLGKAKK